MVVRVSDLGPFLKSAASEYIPRPSIVRSGALGTVNGLAVLSVPPLSLITACFNALDIVVSVLNSKPDCDSSGLRLHVLILLLAARRRRNPMIEIEAPS